MIAERGPALPTSAYDYDLPPELIAQEPTAVRGQSRLLIVDRSSDGALRDTTFPAIVDLIPPDDLLILNSTRVRHARFLGTRASGAPAEVLLLHPGTGDAWIAIGKPGSALRPGKRIRLDADVSIETVEVLDDGNRVVRFVGADAADAIARYGRLPLPPYIRREPSGDDEQRYQTVYAEREGSVAAPTAGLHFTTELLAAVEARGARVGRLDLEVGPGTFRPVDADDPAEHPMHAERFDIPAALVAEIERTRAGGGHIWAAGTTVVRALESASDQHGAVRAGPGETRLLIMPGYRFRVVDRLLTNFHLPRSTLLMLVSAFVGHDRMMAAYRHAVAARYRFYSYGDAMVIV